MKQLFLAVLLLLLVNNINAQEVLVPYRVNNKFGLSDYNGKLIIPPNYDWFEIGSHHPTGYFVFTKGEKKGIIYNKKELIVSDINNEFNILENKFIASRYKEKFDNNKLYNSREEREQAKRNPKVIMTLYNLAGKSVYKENFAKLTMLDTLGKSSKFKRGSKYSLFVSTNFEGKFSVFVFDNDKQLISNWLLKDYEEFKMERGSSILFSLSDAVFYAKKTSISDEELIYFDLVNNDIKMITKIIPKKDKVSGEGTTEAYGLYNNRDLKGDPTTDIVIGEGGRMEPNNKSKIKKYYTSFSIVDGKITFTKTDIYQKATSKEVTLPDGATHPKTEFLYVTLPTTKDSIVVETSNVLTFQLNGNYGLFITDSILIKPIYKKINAINLKSNPPFLTTFLVAVENNQTKKMKFGTIDINDKPIIPIIYDEMTIDNKYANLSRFSNSVYDANFKVTINGKLGKVSAFNKVILDPIYDEIKDNDHNYLFGDDEFQILRKGDKFGLHKANRKIFVPAIFDKQIGFFLPDYQGKKDFNLLGLVNVDGQIFCYARKDGLKYYRAN